MVDQDGDKEQDPLGQIFLEQKVITQEQLEYALKEQSESDEKLGAVLVRLGFVQEETVLKALVAQKKVRIGDLLLELNLISDAQLKQAIDTQKTHGGKLGEVLVTLGFVKQEALLQALAAQLDVSFIDLRQFDYDRKLVMKLPEIYARRFRALVLRDDGRDLIIGMSDPQNILAVDEVARVVACSFKVALVDEGLMLQAFDILYDHSKEITKFAEELSEEIGGESFAITDSDDDLGEADAPVMKLLSTVFEEATRLKASDIHIEPDEHVLRIRLRVDGVLQEQIVNEKNIIAALTQRLKLMGGLNIAEKRLPQDGRFTTQVKDKKIEVRLSTMPVAYGESVVMRLLQQEIEDLRLEALGMPTDILIAFRKMFHRPHGMILVTGPTGSGKTTTLYSALHELNVPGRKLVTVEDPVEYRIPRISQVQVSNKIDLTFARVLRATLRQDPDTIMVGEIRDAESATIALRASMTGHLVLATLHTTDARSSAMRLMDMGVPGYLVAVALRAVLAQRLVRKICDNCKEEHKLDSREKQWIQAVLGEKEANKEIFYIGAGCARCSKTGYSGRAGVYELVVINSEMIGALRKNDESAFYDAIAKEPLSRPLGLCALDIARKGVTSLQEVMRIAEDLEDE